MNNPFLKMIEETGQSANSLLSGRLQGVCSPTTLYNLIDERGIPGKTNWETIIRVSEALGYKVEFVKDDNNTSK